MATVLFGPSSLAMPAMRTAIPFLPNRTVPLSTQCLVCGLALLAYAAVELVVAIMLTFQPPPPGIEPEAVKVVCI